MHILNALIWATGVVVITVTGVWVVSHITAFLLIAYLEWKDGRAARK